MANSEMDRRTFVKTVSAVIGTAALASPATSAQDSVETTDRRRRYAIVGVGDRSGMYQKAIEKTYKDHAVLVGICDTNEGRLQYAQKIAQENGAQVPPAYKPDDFEKMIRDTKPDAIIITSMCSTHSDYIVRGMKAGVDVITEKPMTTTAEKVQQILDAKKESQRHCRVNFNYRYSPPRTQVKELLMSGLIGDILSVDFHWLLNTHHGADYFRRWHRNKKNSGGLMVHKATHHFDLVNWWIGGSPVEVMAMGKREYYTPTMAKRYGLEGPHERCMTCSEKSKCGFYLDLNRNPQYKALYVNNEKYDHYFRDRCVWSPEIDIEDTMNVMVKYDNNVTLSYSLNAFNSWEGYAIAFSGTLGRLEHRIVESIDIPKGHESAIKTGVTITHIPLRGPAKTIEPWPSPSGGHQGGDDIMLKELFVGAPADKYLRAADERSGAASCLIGIAANECFATGKPVVIAEMVSGLAKPDYAPMPGHDLQLPMPGKTA